MITFNNLGRCGLFGNQMFEYAALYAVAKTKRFEFGVPYANTGHVEFTSFFLPHCFKNLSAKDSSSFVPKYFYMEQDFTYDSNLFNISDDTDIQGYFQSEKYFLNYKNDILNEFKFTDDILNKAKNIRSQHQSNVISLHLRLGDYYYNDQNCHPVCALNYYKEAIKQMPDDLLIYVFSNDMVLAKEYLDPLNRKMVFIENNNKYEDMCLMTMCDYHIIANSTFSWWGAWLSNSIKTIAPSKWFGSAPQMPKNWSDIYCKDWTVL
jgi:hypothetical protein